MYTKHTVLSFHGYCDLNHSMDVMYIIHIYTVSAMHRSKTNYCSIVV